MTDNEIGQRQQTVIEEPRNDLETTLACHQRRILPSLWGASLFGRGALSAMFPVSILAAKDLLGSDTWVGVATAAGTVGSATSAGLIASYMQKRGRRPGLVLGFALAASGCLAAIVSIQLGSLWAFLASLVLVGVGSATSNLARYVAADLAAPERRSRDIGSVVFAATFGAVLFPLLIRFGGELAAAVSLDANTGGFAISLLAFVSAGAIASIFLRPDPLKIAARLKPTDRANGPRQGMIEATSVALSKREPRLALVTLVVSQLTMVMVMAMTPLHMSNHGHETGWIGIVISAHTAGMYALAPIAGRVSDRIGRIPTIMIGGATLIVATMVTSLAGQAPLALLVPGLFLLGLGWSFGIVAASALLTESSSPDYRVVIQGAADTAMNVASGIGALSSGLILNEAGYHNLSLFAMVAAGLVLAYGFYQSRLATQS